jgi:hypothetical protein
VVFLAPFSDGPTSLSPLGNGLYAPRRRGKTSQKIYRGSSLPYYGTRIHEELDFGHNQTRTVYDTIPTIAYE